MERKAFTGIILHAPGIYDKLFSSSYICDPDGVLTKEERNNVNNQLRQIEMRTRQDGNSDMCTAKGVTPVIVLVRRARGSIHDMIPALLNKWNLDNTCKKDFIIGYATESRDYHVARNDRGPLTYNELKDVFLTQKTLLKNRQYGPALEGFARQYISKFESMRGPSDGATTTPLYVPDEWDENSMPNPVTEYSRCGMDGPSFICDPDSVLSKEQRVGVNNQLRQIEMRTRQDGQSDLCAAKGVTPIVIIFKKIKSTTSLDKITPALMSKWSLDNSCKKDFIVAYATESKNFHIARNDRGPLTSNELKQVFLTQKAPLKSMDYGLALENFAKEYM
ncbi:hypothetical protein WR25_18147 [Diploscapter pachys]|uniref:Uncharacterized protein n=1 Tax=Diploscapter pachys TaxID=2018661 RepID=A0A2A2LZ12_9BILA|nr:hypothetical protein WR25_18147 [Diploscapter pachys]